MAATTHQLMSSLKELRSDPLIASVLRGDPDTSAGHRLRLHSPTRSQKGADEESVAQNSGKDMFYRQRDANREDVGVSNWLQRHRDQLANEEHRRMENKLRAERLFAQTQLDVESCKLELEHDASRNNTAAHDDLAPEIEAIHIDHDPEPLHTAAPTETRSLTSERSEAPMPSQPLFVEADDKSLHSPQPKVTLDAFRNFSAPSWLSPLHKEIRQQSATTPVLHLDTNSVFGPVDTEANYESKAREYRQSSQGNDDLSALAAHRGDGIHTAGNHDAFLQASAKQDVDLLKEAIEQRERTIRRLEKKVTEDRSYYEQELFKVKSQLSEERISAESRITALRSQIDQMVTYRQGRDAHEVTVEEMTIKLHSVQKMYREALEKLKQETTVKVEEIESHCEARVREVSDRAEQAIRQAKEAFRLERSEYFASEKEHLFEQVQREQELLLREGEANLKEQLRMSVQEKLFMELENSFRKHLQADILPAVQNQLASEILEKTRLKISLDCQGIFATKANDIRVLVRSEASICEKAFLHRFVEAQQQRSDVQGQHASSIRPDSDLIAAVSEKQKFLEATVNEVKREQQKQKQMDDLHEEKMDVYRRRQQQLEENLSAEQQFADAIRKQVEKTSFLVGQQSSPSHGKSDLATEKRDFPEPPWAARTN